MTVSPTRTPLAIRFLVLTLGLTFVGSTTLAASASQGDTTPENVAAEHEATARALNEAYNARDWDAWIALTSEDVEIVMAPTGQMFHGHDGAREFVELWANAFSDSEIETGLVVADEFAAAMEFTGRGTHDGTLVSPAGDIPATGQPVEIAFTQFLEFEDGLIVRARLYFDLASMMMQLQGGATPSPVSIAPGIAVSA